MMVRRLRLRFKFRSSVAPDGQVRLHLGCGQDYWPGYINVDSSPTALCDLRLDYTQIAELYPVDSVAEIALIHSLSYLRLWQARDLLASLHRILVPGGRLIIELPDLSKCAQAALERSEHDLNNYLDAVRGFYAFDLEQIGRKEMFAPYAFGWSGWHLKYELEQIGFREVFLSEPQTHDRRDWRDTRVEATK